MLDLQTVLVFGAAALLLLVTPGPAVLYVVSRSLEQGRLAGLVSTVGLAAGTLVHVVGAALGTSALLASSALAFDAVRYAGALYLVYLGVRRLRERGSGSAPAQPAPAPLRRVLVQGALVSVLNPKAALFLLAFLPQFADPARGPVAAQILTLGAVFVGLALVSDGVYALVAGALGRWLRARGGFPRAQRYFTGSVYLGLGMAAALAGQRK